MNEQTPRFFIDERGGCIAVRDRLHPSYDPEYPGLHFDTPDVIYYAHGETVDGEWKVPDMMRKKTEKVLAHMLTLAPAAQPVAPEQAPDAETRWKAAEYMLEVSPLFDELETKDCKAVVKLMLEFAASLASPQVKGDKWASTIEQLEKVEQGGQADRYQFLFVNVMRLLDDENRILLRDALIERTPKVKGCSVDEVRQIVRETWAMAEWRLSYIMGKTTSGQVPPTLSEHLASLSAKGEAAVSGHELLTGAFLIGPNGPIPFDLAALLEKAQEGSYQHIGGIDQWKEAHDIDDLIEELKSLPVAKGEAPKEDVSRGFLLDELAKADATLEADGYALWSQVRVTIGRADKVISNIPEPPEGTVSAPQNGEGARPPFEKFEDTDLVSIATVKGWFAAPKEGEQPEPAIDLFTLAEQVWQKLDGPKTKGDFLSWEHGFVTGHRMAAPKPNPEPLVAALEQTNKWLEVIVGSLAKNGQLASASLLAQLKHDNAATLTQWEASQPSPENAEGCKKDGCHNKAVCNGFCAAHCNCPA